MHAAACSWPVAVPSSDARLPPSPTCACSERREGERGVRTPALKTACAGISLHTPVGRRQSHGLYLTADLGLEVSPEREKGVRWLNLHQGPSLNRWNLEYSVRVRVCGVLLRLALTALCDPVFTRSLRTYSELVLVPSPGYRRCVPAFRNQYRKRPVLWSASCQAESSTE